MEYTINKQGTEISFTSEITNEEALNLIKDVKSNFHMSLTNQAKKKGLSDKQWAWVHYLAKEETDKNKSVCSLEFDQIWDALHKPTKLQNPSFLVNTIKFAIPYKQDMKHLVAVICDGVFMGYVNDKFEFFGKKDILDFVQEIEYINSDFVKAVKEHGEKNGTCCFCRKKLSTPDSLHNGYGKTCATHYGMPYETVDTTDEEEVFEVGEVVKYTGRSRKINGDQVTIIKINAKTYKVEDSLGNEANVTKSTIFKL
jgi:hypothetical protein